jgi:hypothetical protein
MPVSKEMKMEVEEAMALQAFTKQHLVKIQQTEKTLYGLQ